MAQEKAEIERLKLEAKHQMELAKAQFEKDLAKKEALRSEK